MTPTDELEGHIKSLRHLRDLALATRKIPAAITAEVAIGRALFGSMVDVEQGPKSVYQLTDDELLAIASGAREDKHNATT